jgi:hypothetical protein
MTAGDPLTALRRQLAGLSYDAAGVSPASAPLVAALLADLVKASDSYRSRKQQADNAEQTAHNLQYQVPSQCTPHTVAAPACSHLHAFCAEECTVQRRTEHSATSAAG